MLASLIDFLTTFLSHTYYIKKVYFFKNLSQIIYYPSTLITFQKKKKEVNRLSQKETGEMYGSTIPKPLRYFVEAIKKKQTEKLKTMNLKQLSLRNFVRCNAIYMP